jgi:hypothetical protein
MKKVLFSMLLMAGLITIISFNSCNKPNKSTADPVTTTATIKGKVMADTDLNGTREKAPQGTKIIATIDASDLIDNPVSGTNYGKIQYEAAVNDVGEYTLAITAGTKNVTVTIKADDLIGSSATITRAVLPGPTTTTTVQKDIIKIVDLNY